MNKKHILIAALMSLLVFSFSGRGHSSQGDIETKIAVEQSMEERLRNILVRITGSDKLLVIISVQLHSETDKPEPGKGTIVLPGVPVRESMQQRSVGAMDARTMIKNLRATVILDSGISSEAAEVVKEVTTNILGIDEERGDLLLIQKMDFQANPFSWVSIFVPPHLWWLTASLSAAVFVVFLILFLFGPFRKNFEGLVQSASSKGSREPFGPSFPAASGAAGTPGAAASVNENDEEIPFAFIASVDRTKLSYIFRKLSSENAAMVLSYQPPALAAELFQLVEEDDKRLQIAGILGKIREMSPESVLDVEKKTRQLASYTVGGEGYLEETLNMLDDEGRSKLLENLGRSEPGLADRIKSRIVRPSEIVSLSGALLYEFYSVIGAHHFASLTALLSEAERDEVLAKLPGGLAERLRQEIEMSGKPATKDMNALLRTAIPELRRLLGR